MADRSCVICGETFDAKRPQARYCSARCRNRKARGAQPLDEPGGADRMVVADVGASAVEMVRAELDSVGRLNTWRGAVCMKLAAQIDNATAVMGYAALVKQLEASMVAALAGTQAKATQLDELKARRARKLAG